MILKMLCRLIQSRHGILYRICIIILFKNFKFPTRNCIFYHPFNLLPPILKSIKKHGIHQNFYNIINLNIILLLTNIRPNGCVFYYKMTNKKMSINVTTGIREQRVFLINVLIYLLYLFI